MDLGARDGNLNGKVGKGISALLLFALLAQASCHWGARGGTPPPPRQEEPAGDNTAPAAVMEWLPPAMAADGAEDDAGTSTVCVAGTDNAARGNTAADNTVIDNTAINRAVLDNAVLDNAATGAPGAVAPVASSLPEAMEESAASLPPAVERPLSSSSSGAPPGGPIPEEATPSARRTKSADAPHPVPTYAAKGPHVVSPPGWAKNPEELVYRVDFIGITMGYARFRYQGKVSIAGKPAYHLNVRAWTSGILSYIFPINETIDYYLDAETLAPIRQEFTQREKDKDDVALYNQETGRITYRYRQSGKIRKEVDTIPFVYDPVSVAYYFRWRDLGDENRPRNVYAGRKIYQISSRVLGNERIRTEHGEVDTIAVLPLIRRDGKPDSKGDLKIWFSCDERRVPVRLYAKFRKIKEWTLVGELMPPTVKAGG